MLGLVFEKLSQPLAAGYKWDIGIAGAYLRLSACQWPVTVILYKGGQVIGQMNNMLAGDYVEGIAFDAVTVLNGATAQIVDVQISGGGAGSSRVMGEVSVIDGGKSRVITNQAFSVRLYSNAVVGQFSHAQLFNPAGSSKNVIIDGLSISSALASTFTYGEYSVQLANVNNVPVVSKLLGGAVAPVSLPRYGANEALLLSTYLATVVTPASLTFDLSGMIKAPIVVPPGKGFCIVSQVANQDFSCNLSFIEEAI